MTPQIGRIATGNRCSAAQWKDVLGNLGHEVETSGTEEGIGSGFDVLVALNAMKSFGAIELFKVANPAGRVIIVLTGTDIYPEAGELSLQSMNHADRLVALQSKAPEQVPELYRGKTRVIVQAAPEIGSSRPGNDEFFNIAVVAHFREVKDPLRAAKAVRKLPSISKVRLRHAGAVLEEQFGELIRQEMEENKRYRWLKELAPDEAGVLIAWSDLLVLSSLSEGAGRVIGEAVAYGTPFYLPGSMEW